MKKASELILTGSIAIDRIMDFPGSYKDVIKPDKLHVLSISVLLKKMRDTHGGVAANIAYTLALLGKKPILLGSVGKDAAGYITKLKKLGVNTKHVHFSKLPTAAFNVITDMQDNQVGGFYPGAMTDTKKISLKVWKNSSAFILISPNDPALMRRLVQECKKYKLKYMYDFGQQVSNTSAEDLAEGVKHAEIIIANDYEMAVLCEKIKVSMSELKTKTPVCITTLGEKGSLVEGAQLEKAVQVKAVKPKKVVDPTGAGDAYRAGFIYGYTQGWDLKKCAQLGSTTAAYAVENQGTQEHFFTDSQFRKRFEQSFNNKL